MSRKPEIGNVQLYPNRPLRKSDKNGYVLKFYCPIMRKRIRKACGTRDRREARQVLRECRERLGNGAYVESGGAITKEHEKAIAPFPALIREGSIPESWQECSERYRRHREKRVREASLSDAMLRVGVAERIFETYRKDRGLPEGLSVQEFMTLDMLEYLQDRLLAGDESQLDSRSPNTVNSMMGAVMAFVRFCAKHGWIEVVPALEKLEVEGVMKGRPITDDEFQRMLDATPRVVGDEPAASWQLSLSVLWESGFRIADLMDLTWDDNRHIHPAWPSGQSVHPTLVIPSTQKNGRVQEIPMLPGLGRLLSEIPSDKRKGWIVSPQPIQYEIRCRQEYIRPTDADLRLLASRYSNSSIARACGVSDTSVRKWLASANIRREEEFQINTGEIPKTEVALIRKRGVQRRSRSAQRSNGRLTTERVSRVISMIGKEAEIVVRQKDDQRGKRVKYASAHDIRRGCAQRLINLGVSAETLKVVLRHRDFATTEKFYGAMRSAQSAASEINEKIDLAAGSQPIVGGLMGGKEKAPELSTCPRTIPVFVAGVVCCWFLDQECQHGKEAGASVWVPCVSGRK